MKQIHFILLFIASFGMNPNVYSQQFSLEQTKEILTSYNWKMSSYTSEDGEKNYLADNNTAIIYFSKNGAMTIFRNADDSPLEPLDYSITNNQIYYGQLVEDAKLNYTLEQNESGYILSITNDDLGNETVFMYDSVNPAISAFALPTNRSVIIGAGRESYDGTPADAPTIISKINSLLKQAIGNIGFWKDGGQKFIIEDNYFTVGEMGTKLVETAKDGNDDPNTFSYEFNPENIKDVTIKYLPNDSPVGILKLEFYGNNDVYRQIIRKKKDPFPFYSSLVLVSYLKIDQTNFSRLKELFLQLKELYSTKENQRLSLLQIFTEEDKEFWISGDGISQTYSLNEAQFTGCTMRFHYDLKTISTSGDSKGSFITEIPLKDIENITLDKGKSRPNTILLHAGKNGFRTFKIDDDSDYVPDTAVSHLPIFIDVSTSKKLERVLELIKTHCKECGGPKLKLK
ncbi:hypothetical protein ATE92_2073 [Ulvibacter sp. MAR_2010_11]|uniref:hypothetical protein n=1 Tax=Ulvibacter sp. MAR_2010_11 TaxID=1250229 RepID=UPI000C2C7C9F|nr:hypothetical protein [Ulvibacter sp. MAR_2010_11]PKA83904.1 hypothetical protein ATE92_2073 [Ulvibacter sp. MAR_2010_11]